MFAPFVRFSSVLSALALAIVTHSGREAEAGRLSSRLSPDTLAATATYFTGSWACAGGTPSGRILNSDVVFSSVLGGRFLQSRHTDRAPGRYESISLWPDTMPGNFATVVYDNFGGARRFFAETTASRTVVLLRDTLQAGARLESFTYRGISDSTYWYAWYVRRAPGARPVLGDSATCRRT